MYSKKNYIYTILIIYHFKIAFPWKMFQEKEMKEE